MIYHFLSFGFRAAVLALLFASYGCKVGPNYMPQVVNVPEQFAEQHSAEVFEPSAEDLCRWWRRFNDPILDELMEDAVEGNFDYLIAVEKINQARALYWMEFTHLLPEFDFGTQASRSRQSQAFRSGSSNLATPTPQVGVSPIRNFYRFGFDAIWELDFFGKLRRATTAAYRTWEATIETSRAIKISMLSEVADRYTAIRAYQQKKSIALASLQQDRDLLALAQDRFQAGLNSQVDVDNAKISLGISQADLELQETLLMQQIYAMGVLVGQLPECIAARFAYASAIPEASGMVPAGIPADLLFRRPDVRSLERQLAAATEQVGVAVAQLYPSVSLTGSTTSFAANPLQGANWGYSSDQLSRLFTNPARIWGIGLLLQVPIFDFGNRMAGIEYQVSVQRESALAFQKGAIAALQEVEQALTAYFHEEKRLQALKMTVNSNYNNYKLALDRFEAGLEGMAVVLQLKDSWLGSMNAMIDSQQQLVANMIALYKSLGGEWTCC